jgi:hypothetical protein
MTKNLNVMNERKRTWCINLSSDICLKISHQRFSQLIFFFVGNRHVPKKEEKSVSITI